MSKQLMQRALDALSINRVMAQDADGNYTKEVTPKVITAAIEELRAAIAQPEVEPVAGVVLRDGWPTLTRFIQETDTRLFTTPPDTEAMRQELEQQRTEAKNWKRWCEESEAKAHAELERVKGEGDAMEKALTEINKLDPLNTDEGFNEWGEALCFRSAQEIAAAAIAAQGGGE